MNTLSMKELKSYLNEYELHLKYWHPNDGDGNELLGCRELLEENHDLLTKEEENILIELDKKARKLLENYKGPDSFDIIMMKKTVAIAAKHIKQAA